MVYNGVTYWWIGSKHAWALDADGDTLVDDVLAQELNQHRDMLNRVEITERLGRVMAVFDEMPRFDERRAALAWLQ